MKLFRILAVICVVASVVVVAVPAGANTKPPASCLKALKAGDELKTMNGEMLMTVDHFFNQMKTAATQNPSLSAFFAAYAYYANDMNNTLTDDIPGVQLVLADYARYSRQCRAGK